MGSNQYQRGVISEIAQKVINNQLKKEFPWSILPEENFLTIQKEAIYKSMIEKGYELHTPIKNNMEDWQKYKIRKIRKGITGNAYQIPIDNDGEDNVGDLNHGDLIYQQFSCGDFCGEVYSGFAPYFFLGSLMIPEHERTPSEEKFYRFVWETDFLENLNSLDKDPNDYVGYNTFVFLEQNWQGTSQGPMFAFMGNSAHIVYDDNEWIIDIFSNNIMELTEWKRNQAVSCSNEIQLEYDKKQKRIKKCKKWFKSIKDWRIRNLKLKQIRDIPIKFKSDNFSLGDRLLEITEHRHKHIILRNLLDWYNGDPYEIAKRNFNWEQSKGFYLYHNLLSEVHKINRRYVIEDDPRFNRPVYIRLEEDHFRFFPNKAYVADNSYGDKDKWIVENFQFARYEKLYKEAKTPKEKYYYILQIGRLDCKIDKYGVYDSRQRIYHRFGDRIDPYTKTFSKRYESLIKDAPPLLSLADEHRPRYSLEAL